MNTADPLAHRRLVIELGHAGSDPEMVRAAAEFAHLLGLPLHGVFVEDEALLALAELPFAREIRLPTHEWSPLAGERLAEELRHAAEQAHQALRQIVAGLGVPHGFEVRRGDPVACLAELCSAADILVLTQRETRPTLGTARPRGTAPELGSVLLLPPGRLRRGGPVAVMLHGAEDRLLDAAASIATEAGAGLLLLLPTADIVPAALARAEQLGVPRARLGSRVMKTSAADDIMAALGPNREQLIVISRHNGDTIATGARIATARGVPVLVTTAAT